jgi:hypothetical protein
LKIIDHKISFDELKQMAEEFSGGEYVKAVVDGREDEKKLQEAARYFARYYLIQKMLITSIKSLIPLINIF